MEGVEAVLLDGDAERTEEGVLLVMILNSGTAEALDAAAGVAEAGNEEEAEGEGEGALLLTDPRSKLGIALEVSIPPALGVAEGEGALAEAEAAAARIEAGIAFPPPPPPPAEIAFAIGELPPSSSSPFPSPFKRGMVLIGVAAKAFCLLSQPSLPIPSDDARLRLGKGCTDH